MHSGQNAGPEAAQFSPPPPQQHEYPPGTVRPGEGGYRGNHPVAAFFHFFFKLAAILVYLLATTLGMSFIAQFITVVLILSVDFWITKNVTGRVMVRLRWWNHIREDGENEWIFESHPNAAEVNGADSYFFWIVTYGCVIVWLALLVFTVTSPTNIPLTGLAAILCGANALGYTKCRRDAKSKLAKFAMGNPGLAMAAVGAPFRCAGSHPAELPCFHRPGRQFGHMVDLDLHSHGFLHKGNDIGGWNPWGTHAGGNVGWPEIGRLDVHQRAHIALEDRIECRGCFGDLQLVADLTR